MGLIQQSISLMNIMMLRLENARVVFKFVIVLEFNLRGFNS